MNARSALRQSIFTVIAKPDSNRVGELETYLAHVDDVFRRRLASPFGELAMLHFCSFTIFHDDNLGPYLVFENNIDGTPHDYIDALCTIAAPTLHTIYAFCDDYDFPNGPTATSLRCYLRTHIVYPAAGFVGNVGRSVERIRNEAALVTQIHDFLDRFDVPERTAPEAVVTAVREFVCREAKWSRVGQARPRLSIYDRASRWAAVLGLAIAATATLPFSLFLVAAAFVVLRRLERSDPIDIAGPTVTQLQQLTAREDQIVQNHMASLCYVKPGAFRRRTLKLVLFLANLLARISTSGRLSGLDSLHFAHWSLIDNDTRLLFLTNYDGSWENYLDDFIEKAAIGLTAIWSNTKDFPRTSFLVFDGARDERSFKAIARTTQAYTNLWYSAYPTLTVNGIENNTAICEALFYPTRAFDAASWLRRF